ncbi:MAG: cardiolipin synthase [Angelakisella sp.]
MPKEGDVLKKRWFGVLFRRRAYVVVLLLLQFAILLVMTLSSVRYFHFMYWVLGAVSFFVALFIINKKEKPAYKLTWVILILLLPIFGGLFYLIFRFQSSLRLFRKRQSSIEELTKPLLQRQDECLVGLGEEFGNLPRYLQNFAGLPVYGNTRTQYLTPGEKKLTCLLEQLRKAERYIFLEYFIVAGGFMWDSILGVLKERVAAGVEVRLLYDDMGCLLLLPSNYPKTIEKLGIQCRVFSPFRPVLSSLQNNRDHRKIAVIDGKIAFTGGINLADEYINAAERLGHWKDAALMMEGDAAWSFTVMFLEMWSLAGATAEDFSRFLPTPVEHSEAVQGYVQPYCDSPLDSDNVGEHVYLQIISNARHYLYINSPYLIVDDSMLSALMLAAKGGVDVCICTPRRGDKWMVHMTTRSYYRDLIQSGIRIYEYSPGFMHSKTFVSDDHIATVGTTNLDFRSLYLHFECGACLYNTSTVADIKEDYLQTLTQCKQMTMEDCHNAWPVRLFQEVLRVFAPLM